MTALLQDLRFALRTLRNRPTFALVAVFTIAIGIGANTTIYSWLRSLVLNPFPGAADPQHIVAIENTAPDGEPITTSYLDFRDFRDHLRLVNNVTAYRGYLFSVGEAPNVERAWGEMVSGAAFDMLGVKPEAGRFFSLDERDDAQNAHAVIVISHDYWKSHYGMNPSAVGSTMRVNRTPLTIIGVAPEGFHGLHAGLEFSFWIPLTMYGQMTHTGTWMLNDRNTRNFSVLARLAPGVSIDQARGEVQALAKRMAEADADSNLGIGAVVLPVWKSHFGMQSVLVTPVAILMGIGGVVLLIVCANLANLLLARATSRTQEFSIRMALGANAWRLVIQLLTETLLMVLAGAFGGLILSKWLAGALRWLLPGVAFPTLSAPPLDIQIFAFTAGLAVIVTLLAGLVPALQSARTNINDALKEGGRTGTTTMHAHRLRGAMVVSEVALAFVALVGASVFLQSFRNARTVDPGFSPDGIALAQFDFSTAGYTAQQTDNFCRRLHDRMQQLPGVTSVSYDDSVPLGFFGGNWETLEVEGFVPKPNENMKIYRDLVSPGFFESMKIPLVDGRDFDWHDDASALKVMIVNQEFVRRFVPSGNALGRKVHGWGEWFTIVGIAKDSKYHRLTENPQPYFYIPIRQIFRPEYGLTFQVRTSGSINEAISGLRREAAAIDPGLTIFDAEPMTEYIAGSLFGAKISANLLTLLSGIGLLLAAMGLYGVLAYSVAQRTREFGVRVAMGAKPRDILALILRESARLTLSGAVVGLFMAALSARIVAQQIYGISPLDPLTYIGVALLLAAVAVAASSIPALRAARVNPIVALRYE
ncbi:MAG TPA: ABC transporter permease [Dongiaceae bacterium]|nr:ABC transporter permease [Dongiaceae bacterium]